MRPEALRTMNYEVAEAIAPTWERRRAFVEEILAPVRRWMIDALAPSRGDTVLELAAGVGDTGFEAAGMLGAEGRLISSDISLDAGFGEVHTSEVPVSAGFADVGEYRHRGRHRRSDRDRAPHDPRGRAHGDPADARAGLRPVRACRRLRAAGCRARRGGELTTQGGGAT